MTPAIEIEGFSYSIGAKTILDMVGLTVPGGSYTSIIGPNGAGKSTLLKCLMRIYHGGEGRIEIDGTAIESYSQRKLAQLLSYVPQSDGRSLPFTVEEYIMLGRYPYLSPFTTVSAEDNAAVHDALKETGTYDLAKRHLGTLSGGERQTVSIAAALAQGSPIMLLDEPTTFLDPRHATDIRKLLRRLNRDRSITIVSVTHDINHAALESTGIAILKNGSIIHCGTPDDTMNAETLSNAFDTPFRLTKHPDTGSIIIIPEADNGA